MTALKLGMAAVLAATLVACGDGGGGGKPVQSAEAGGKKITLSTASGQLTSGENAMTLTFTDASGQPAAVDAPAVRFTMPAEPNMAEMNAEAKLEPAGQPGAFKGTVDLDMKGPWQTVVTFKDNGAVHRATFTVQAH